jgi:hypothetical protein
VRTAHKRDNGCAPRRLLCPTANIANTDIRMEVMKLGRNHRLTDPLRKTLSAHGPSRCRGRAPFPAAPNVARYCNRRVNLQAAVPNVASSFIPASSALTSIPPADSSVRSQSPNGFHEKMRATNVASIPCESWWKRKRPLRLQCAQAMPGRRLRIFSRSRTA